MTTLGPAVGRVRLGPNRPLLALRNTRVLWEGTMQKGVITLRLWARDQSHPHTRELHRRVLGWASLFTGLPQMAARREAGKRTG